MKNIWLVRCYKNIDNDVQFDVGNCYLAEVSNDEFKVYKNGIAGESVSRSIKGTLASRLYFYNSDAFIEVLGYSWKIMSSVCDCKVCIEREGAISLENAESYLAGWYEVHQ